MLDSGGLGGMQIIFAVFRGKWYFMQLDSESGLHQVLIAEKDTYKMILRDADGRLYEFNRAGFGLALVPAAFTTIVKRALGTLALM